MGVFLVYGWAIVECSDDLHNFAKAIGYYEDKNKNREYLETCKNVDKELRSCMEKYGLRITGGIDALYVTLLDEDVYTLNSLPEVPEEVVKFMGSDPKIIPVLQH